MERKVKFIALLVISLVVVAGCVTCGVDLTSALIGSGGVVYFMAAPMVGPGSGSEGGASGEDYDTAGLTEEDLNKIIVKVRPSDTPLDTLTREISNTQTVSNRETGGYEIGTRDIEDATTIAFDGSTDVTNLAVGKKSIWQISDTLYVPGVAGGDGKPLMLYIAGKDNAAGTLQVVAANPVADKIPAIPSGSKLMRLGKAMGEVDAQTDAFTALPSNRKNYTQIHMAQVEVSTLSELYKKKVAIDFTTHKELSLWDMKRAMEFTNIFGVKGKFIEPVNNKIIYTSDGLWNQLTGVCEYDKAVAPTNAFFTKLTRQIFDGNNGSDRRILLAGPDLIEWLSQVEMYSKQQRPEGVDIVHGIRFNKIITSFGELLVKPMSSLFVGDTSWYGMVLDMSYIRKDVQEALQTKELDLDSTGQRRVKAVRILENYALFAENLAVHKKIMPKVA